MLKLSKSIIRVGIVVSPRTDDYRARAAECERKAMEADDPDAKKDFADAARYWRDLADQAERLGW